MYVDPATLQSVESELSVARMEARAGQASTEPLRSAVLLAFAAPTACAGVAALEALCAAPPYSEDCAWWLAAAYLETERWGRARFVLTALLEADPRSERAAALLQLCAGRVRAQARAFAARAGQALLGVAFVGLVVLPALRARPLPPAPASRLQGVAAAAGAAASALVGAAAAAGAAAAGAGQPGSPRAGAGGGGGGYLLPSVLGGLWEEGARQWAAARRAAGV